MFACVIARSTFSDFTTDGFRKQFRVIVPGEVKRKQPSLCSVQTDISSRRPCPLLCPHRSVQTGSCFRAALHFRLSTLVSFVWLTIPDQAKGVENAQVNGQKMRGLMSTWCQRQETLVWEMTCPTLEFNGVPVRYCLTCFQRITKMWDLKARQSIRNENAWKSGEDRDRRIIRIWLGKKRTSSPKLCLTIESGTESSVCLCECNEVEKADRTIEKRHGWIKRLHIYS